MAPFGTAGGSTGSAKAGRNSGDGRGVPSMQAARPRRGRSASALKLLVGIAQHLVGGGDHLGIDLVSALRLDHVDQFLDDVDVRRFEHALADRPAALGSRGSDLRRAAGGGFGEEVVPHSLEARWINETRELDLAK